MNQNFEQQSGTRKTILTLLKQNGFETISTLKKKLTISSEGIRLQLMQLERDGFVKRYTERNGSKGGRPAFKISLTSKGESLFPKQYDALTVELIDTALNQLGMAAVKKVLSTMVDARVSEWEGPFSVLNLEGKIAALKDLYTSNDQFMEVEHHPETNTILIKEQNCPFHNVAMQRPILCSVTLNTLTRLLGCRVVREKRFQDGDGCCVFRVELDQPIDSPSFSFEEEK
jgi:DeoR family transcriptional regulator, suf operon transcriptional repressor